MVNNLRWLGKISSDYFNEYRRIGLSARHFYMPEDTDAFCRLVSNSVRRGDFIADLGCGDGIATIHAIEKGARRAIAIDISSSAITSTLENWETWRKRNNGSQNSLETFRIDMLDFLRSPQDYLQGRTLDLVVTNPPYVPVGTEKAVDTINGGPDGLRFIEPMLRHGSQIVQRLSWLQGSFSNPLEMLRIASAENWKCDELLAYAVKFRENAMKQANYLESLQRKGEAFFFTESDQSTRWFVKLGMICTSGPGQAAVESMQSLHVSLSGFLSAFNDLGPELGNRDFSFPIPVEYGIYPE
jgi:methylase of polypeptide subunit release factors